MSRIKLILSITALKYTRHSTKMKTNGIKSLVYTRCDRVIANPESSLIIKFIVVKM